MMKRNTLIVGAFIFLFAFHALYAKNVIITLHDGTEILGKIIKVTDTKAVLKTIAGKKVINRSDIKSAKKVDTNKEKYTKELAKRDMTRADSHFEMAQWCLRNNMKMYYHSHLNKALEIDPQHENTHKALGNVPYEKKWIDNGGRVQRKIIWVTKQKKRSLLEQERRKAEKIKSGTKTADNRDEMYTASVSLPRHEPLAPEERQFIMRYVGDLGSSNWRTRSIAVNTILKQEFLYKMPPIIVDVLRKGSSTAKISAMEILLKMNYGPALSIIQTIALKNNPPEVRKKAAFLLGELGGPASAKILLKLLDDGNGDVAAEAVTALEKITFIPFDFLGKPDVRKARAVYKPWVDKNGSRTRKDILEQTARAGDPRNRITASKYLFKMGETEALFNLVELLTHEDVLIQAEANRMLMKLTGEDFLFDPKAHKDLKENCASNWDAYVRKLIREPQQKTARAASGEHAVVIPNSIQALDGMKKEREEVQKRLRTMNKSEAIPLLIRALNSNNFFIRARAISLLREISGNDRGFGYDPGEEKETIRLAFIQRWKKWFADNKQNLSEQKP